MHVLTIDLEEWFHLLDFDATRGEEQWSRYEVRIYENTERILTLLEDSGTKATFFVIGWIARQYPDLVRKIAEKYRLGTHTENHQLVWQQKPEEFKRDLVDSIHRLEDISGKRCEVFRAPGFSIRPSEAWVFDMLAESGIRYDSSIFPARASHGGWPGFPADGPVRIATRTSDIKEFPMPRRTLAGHPFVFPAAGISAYFPILSFGNGRMAPLIIWPISIPETWIRASLSCKGFRPSGALNPIMALLRLSRNSAAICQIFLLRISIQQQRPLIGRPFLLLSPQIGIDKKEKPPYLCKRKNTVSL